MSIRMASRRYIDPVVLRVEKARLGLKWEDLSHATDAHKVTLHLYMTGERRAPPKVIATLEKLLRLPPGALVLADQAAAREKGKKMVLESRRREAAALMAKTNAA